MIKDCIKIIFSDQYPENERVMAGCFLGIYSCFLCAIFIALFAVLSASDRVNHITGWEYNISYPLNSYHINNVKINDEHTKGDNSNWNTDSHCDNNCCDIIGVFVRRDGIDYCTGGVYANDVNIFSTTIDVYGAAYVGDQCVDNCDQIRPGETPHFKIYDHRTGVITRLTVDAEPFSGNNTEIYLNNAFADYEYSEGDVNLDSDVNILDVTTLINIILEED